MPTANIGIVTPRESGPPLKGYAICTSPRSGSNFVGQALQSTGCLGAPLEYFNAEGRRATEAPDYPDDIFAQLEWIKTKGATPNGVYALKLFPAQFAAALKQTDLFAALPDLGFVRLRRRDRLGQAISWARAQQTGQYRGMLQPRGEARYDSRAIMTFLVEVARIDAAWDVYFSRTGLEPAELSYEAVEAEPQLAADVVARLLGLERAPEVDLSKIEITRQRDALNEDWRARFLAEFGGRHWIDLM